MLWLFQHNVEWLFHGCFWLFHVVCKLAGSKAVFAFSTSSSKLLIERLGRSADDTWLAKIFADVCLKV